MKIQLKRSNVIDGGKAKEPTAAQMEYGELAVNYNDGDPAVFLKDSTDTVIRIAGKGATGLDGDYVNITGDNMTGNLTLGTDKVVLDATNGSATFAGGITSGGDQILETGSLNVYQSSNSGSTPVFNGGWSSGGKNITSSIFSNGSASFSGDVYSGGDPNNGTADGVRLNNLGTVYAARSTDTNSIWSGYTVGNTTPTSTITAGGSATFAGTVTAATFDIDALPALA